MSGKTDYFSTLKYFKIPMNVESNNCNTVFIDVIHKILIKIQDKGKFVVVRLLCFTLSDKILNLNRL